MAVSDETWRNESKVTVVVRKYDRHGDISHAVMAPGQTLVLSTTDRLANSDEAVSKKVDPFCNGLLHPVRIADDVEGYEEIASNPNILSEDELGKLFKGHHATFKKRVAEITNLSTLSRMMDLASDESVGASLAQVRTLEERTQELKAEDHYGPEVRVVESRG